MHGRGEKSGRIRKWCPRISHRIVRTQRIVFTLMSFSERVRGHRVFPLFSLSIGQSEKAEGARRREDSRERRQLPSEPFERVTDDQLERDRRLSVRPKDLADLFRCLSFRRKEFACSQKELRLRPLSPVTFSLLTVRC